MSDLCVRCGGKKPHQTLNEEVTVEFDGSRSSIKVVRIRTYDTFPYPTQILDYTIIDLTNTESNRYSVKHKVTLCKRNPTFGPVTKAFYNNDIDSQYLERFVYSQTSDYGTEGSDHSSEA